MVRFYLDKPQTQTGKHSLPSPFTAAAATIVLSTIWFNKIFRNEFATSTRLIVGEKLRSINRLLLPPKKNNSTAAAKEF
ncbi:MAG: hypothetical protein JO297_11475 [Nitrososphaeraceae archaeon]|nr:hypothetical protein [Nitrososphaeraceae archaeon]